jgi:hypothetical protein
MPWIYRWRMRARIYRWYANLAAVDTQGNAESTPTAYENNMAELDELEKNVANVNVPRPYAQGLFHLRMHIDMLRKKLTDTQKSDR